MGGRHLGASRYVYLAACKPLAKLGAGAGGVHAQALQQATQLGLTHALIKTAARATAATKRIAAVLITEQGSPTAKDALTATNTTQRCTPASSHSSRPSTA